MLARMFWVSARSSRRSSVRRSISPRAAARERASCPPLPASTYAKPIWSSVSVQSARAGTETIAPGGASRIGSAPEASSA